MKPNSSNLFEALAEDMVRSWAVFENDLTAFAALATNRLNSLRYDFDLNQFHTLLTQWLLNHPDLPEQVNVHNTFGQPPITLFNNGRFVIDLYIWRGCDTSIHSHGFRGAFKVLHGLSLHEVFDVETEKVIAPDVSLTKLGRPRLEILRAGDVRTIHPDQALTHRVIHLENPTITLCVKTLNEATASQWHHFESGVAIKKRHIEPSLLKKAYIYQYLIETDEALGNSFLKSWLAPLDVSTRMNLCEDLSMGVCDLPEDLVQAILENACAGFETSEWFQRFQKSSVIQAEDIELSSELSPLIRLAIHFANTGWKFSDAEVWLREIQNDLTKSDLTRSVFEVLDEDNPAYDAQLRRWKAFIDE